MSTSPKNDNLLRSIFEVLISHGFEGFNPVLQTLLNEVMKAERSGMCQRQVRQNLL
jgi:hypothetical protein